LASCFALLASQGIWAPKYPDNPKAPQRLGWLRQLPCALQLSNGAQKLGRKRPQTVRALIHLKSVMLGCPDGEGVSATLNKGAKNQGYRWSQIVVSPPYRGLKSKATCYAGGFLLRG
jgi:hypothetical protein